MVARSAAARASLLRYPLLVLVEELLVLLLQLLPHCARSQAIHMRVSSSELELQLDGKISGAWFPDLWR